MKIFLLIAAIVLVFPSTSQSAWWLSELHDSTDAERISDEPTEFRLGNMSCGATKTDFGVLPDGSVTESRTLYCWTAEETKVSIIARCRYPYYSVHELTIDKGGRYYSPALACGPEKKSP